VSLLGLKNLVRRFVLFDAAGTWNTWPSQTFWKPFARRQYKVTMILFTMLLFMIC